MKKLIIFLLIALAFWAPGGWLHAASDDFQTDGSVTLESLATLRINNGGKVAEMTVNTDSLSFTVASGSVVTIESDNRLTLSWTGSGGTFTCPASGASYLTIAATTAETGTISVSSAPCSIAYSGGSGGGSGGGVPTPTAITPSNPAISIKAGAVETTAAEVALTLSATNATQMMISNRADFIGASWETYATSKTWTLASGLGKKTVYVKYKSSTGNESAVVSDNVMLLPTPAVKGITASAGGKVGLPDNLVAVDVPVNAVAKATNVTITPTSVYTAPTGKTKLAGSQVYDFKAEADGAAVKTFSKDLTLTFKYTADDIKGLSEGTLAVYYWDEATSKWVKIGGTVDKVNKTITTKVNHFTLFAIFGEESEVKGGMLVKLKCDAANKSICSAVYYVGNDGKRYVFPNEKIYYTWFADFSSVKEITATELASYMIGGNVNYKPGAKMVKITSDPKVYVVSKGGVLRPIKDEAAAKALYGATWNKQIDDLSDAFFFSYKIGKEVVVAADYDKSAEATAVTSINADKGL